MLYRPLRRPQVSIRNCLAWGFQFKPEIGRLFGVVSTRKPLSRLPPRWWAAEVKFAEPTKRTSRTGSRENRYTLACTKRGAIILTLPARVRSAGKMCPEYLRKLANRIKKTLHGIVPRRIRLAAKALALLLVRSAPLALQGRAHVGIIKIRGDNFKVCTI